SSDLWLRAALPALPKTVCSSPCPAATTAPWKAWKPCCRGWCISSGFATHSLVPQPQLRPLHIKNPAYGAAQQYNALTAAPAIACIQPGAGAARTACSDIVGQDTARPRQAPRMPPPPGTTGVVRQGRAPPGTAAGAGTQHCRALLRHHAGSQQHLPAPSPALPRLDYHQSRAWFTRGADRGSGWADIAHATDVCEPRQNHARAIRGDVCRTPRLVPG